MVFLGIFIAVIKIINMLNSVIFEEEFDFFDYFIHDIGKWCIEIYSLMVWVFLIVFH